MVPWHILIRSVDKTFKKSYIFVSKVSMNNVISNITHIRSMSSTMNITSTKWQWHKTKDLVHFYFMVAAIPLGVITFCANIFVGPATLTPIPDNYEPKYWEYYKHPISRFLARYIYNNPQKDYEKTLHVLYEETQVMKIRELEKRVWELQAERKDYKHNYFLPFSSYAIREFREIVKHNRDNLD